MKLFSADLQNTHTFERYDSDLSSRNSQDIFAWSLQHPFKTPGKDYCWVASDCSLSKLEGEGDDLIGVYRSLEAAIAAIQDSGKTLSDSRLFTVIEMEILN